MENWLETQGKSIADNWNLDNETFDKETLLATIVLTGGTFEPLYPGNPDYFRMMSGYWWKKHERTFEKWFTVFEKEYNPIWDRDGYEEVHEDTYDVGTDDTTTANTEVMDDDTTHTNSITEVMDDDTTHTSNKGTTGHNENKVSAYDSSTYQPHDESDSTGSESITESGTDDRTTRTTENGSGTDDRTTTFNGTVDNDTTNDRDFDRTYHSWGNWGISQTVQKLITQELEVQAFDVYQKMANLFCQEMTVMVY